MVTFPEYLLVSNENDLLKIFVLKKSRIEHFPNYFSSTSICSNKCFDTFSSKKCLGRYSPLYFILFFFVLLYAAISFFTLLYDATFEIQKYFFLEKNFCRWLSLCYTMARAVLFKWSQLIQERLRTWTFIKLKGELKGNS